MSFIIEIVVSKRLHVIPLVAFGNRERRKWSTILLGDYRPDVVSIGRGNDFEPCWNDLR